MAQTRLPQVGVRLLGGFELYVNRRVAIDCTWARNKPKLLLKLLALQPAYRMHREELIEALWPGVDPASGSNNLHQVLHLLRRKLGDERIIQITDNHVGLAGRVSTDVDGFRRAVATAHLRRDRASCDVALALYQGELLPEDRFEPWAAHPRDEIGAAYRSLLLTTSELLVEAGDLVAAEQRLRELIALDPLEEGPHLRLMHLLARSGSPRRAMSVYRTLRANLESELSVEPCEEVTSLAESLRERIAAGGDDPAAERLDVRYVNSRDGTSIAYASHGMGEGVPLLHMPVLPWSDLQVEWSIPEWRLWVLRLAKRRPVIRYNLRGVGLSQAGVVDLGVDRQAEDIETVLDALGISQCDILSTDAASIITLAFAARHPERVRRLAFHFGFADGPAYAEGFERAGLRAVMRYDYDAYVAAFASAAAGFDDVLARSIALWMKSTPIDVIDAYWDMVTAIDATPSLPAIRAPALMLKRRGAWNSEGWALTLKMAAAMPNARVLEVEGSEFHFIAGDIEPLAFAIDEFLGAPVVETTLAL